jgi:hypothetical protein
MLTALIVIAETLRPDPSFPVVASATKADRLDVLASAACAQQTWPNFSVDCLRYGDHGQHVSDVRVVTPQ